jgi:hypothetical protein
MTGRGEGYCVLELAERERTARGYAGLEGAPARLEAPAAFRTRWPPTAARRAPTFGRRRVFAARRRRGRLPRW